MKSILIFLAALSLLPAQTEPVVWSAAEKPIVDGIKGLRAVPDADRGAVTKRLALEIHALPASEHKLTLANSLANLSTEGDFGLDSLQQVGDTLADCLREREAASKGAMPEEPYVTLAQLIRYEHVHQNLESPLLHAAMTRLESEEQRRRNADFTLTDLDGRDWHLSALRGKVVLVNFWATWCPPCRKEMPDLDELYTRFRSQGLVILAVSDEDAATVKTFLAGRKITYPI
ncbi:MAG: TlpA family protein disulfide reductase, partial [Acidobacteriota bacterium]|nr:TlpA family protein disulfide reductase [Acidobacteriota bacterium]